MDAFTPDQTEQDDDARYACLRADARHSMLLLATIRRQDRPEVSVKIRNLSSGGLMAETPSGFLRDESVELELRGIGLVTGKVAWVAPGKVGIRFDWQVDPKAARKPVTGGPQPALVKVATTMWRPGF